jgi:imidazoleglycerol-phosphate dehydratase
MKNRKATIKRKTKETDINLTWNLDGKGTNKINTGIPFFDHMLQLFSAHGLFDLDLKVKGDIEVDFHHTVEDVGICMGQAYREAIDNAKGITRFASCIIPMDETLCQIAIDVSGRPYFEWNRDSVESKNGVFNGELAEAFFSAFVDNARITLHIDLLRGKNLHHMLEACFKAFGICLDQATMFDDRKKGAIPSTKGILL